MQKRLRCHDIMASDLWLSARVYKRTCSTPQSRSSSMQIHVHHTPSRNHPLPSKQPNSHTCILHTPPPPPLPSTQPNATHPQGTQPNSHTCTTEPPLPSTQPHLYHTPSRNHPSPLCSPIATPVYYTPSRNPPPPPPPPSPRLYQGLIDPRSGERACNSCRDGKVLVVTKNRTLPFSKACPNPLGQNL